MVAEPPPKPRYPSVPPPPPSGGHDPAAWGRAAIGGMIIVKACVTIGAAILVAVAGFFILSIFRSVAAEQGVVVGPLVRFFLANPWVVTIPALGAITCAVWLIVTPAYRWTMLVLSTLFLVGAVVILLWAMIAVMGPLYQIR